MTKRIVYFVGEPGCGKTTFVRELMRPWEPVQHRKPFAHISYDAGDLPLPEQIAQLGRQDRVFGGTDALSMMAIEHVIPWLQTTDYDTIVGEGDRLAVDRFMKAAEDAGGLILVHVDCDPAVAEERRNRRSSQNGIWVRGRQTKIANLLQRWAHIVVHGDGDIPKQAVMLRRILGWSDEG